MWKKSRCVLSYIVSMTDSPRRSATVALLRASVRLDPDVGAIRDSLAAPDLDWDDALYLADGHGITPLLLHTWRGLGLDALIPESARARMELAYRDNATRNADARRELLEIWSLLTAADVPVIVLKGLPLIDALYADPALRVLYDFDLLVPADRAQAGLAALLAHGFERVPTKPHAYNNKHLPSVWRLNGFQRRGYLFDPAQPRPVELHVALWDSNWRGLSVRPLDDLWPRSRTLSLDGISMRVLSPEDVFLHLCVHLATHIVEREARVGQLLDVALFVQRSGETLDWDRIVQAGRAAGIARLAYLSICAAHALAGAPLPPPDVMRQLAALTPARLREWAEQHAADDLLGMDYRQPDLGRDYALTFAAAKSIAERMGVVRFALFPPLDALAEQYKSPVRVFGIHLYARHILDRGRAYAGSLLRL